jgi:hypothetical protein
LQGCHPQTMSDSMPTGKRVHTSTPCSSAVQGASALSHPTQHSVRPGAVQRWAAGGAHRGVLCPSASLCAAEPADQPLACGEGVVVIAVQVCVGGSRWAGEPKHPPACLPVLLSQTATACSRTIPIITMSVACIANCARFVRLR